MTIPILLFILGLLLLIKGGDWFVDGSVSIAQRFRIPELLIGATIVSVGTTLPEVMVSAGSAMHGLGDIAYGNAIGSIICNTSLISALTIAFAPSVIDKKPLKIPVCFFFSASIVYLIAAYTIGFTRVIGTLLLMIFIAYMAISIVSAKDEIVMTKRLDKDDTESKDTNVEKLWLSIVKLALGAACIAFGADFLVDNGTIIAKALGVPDSVIALTFVALGTSLPELVTAITSLLKGHGVLSLGNIIGANFFDLVLVSGLASVLSPFSVPQEKMLFGYNASLVLDLPLMVAVMAILTLPPLIKGKLTRIQGIILLLIYSAFCVVQFA